MRPGRRPPIESSRARRAAPLVGLAARTAVGRVNASLKERLGDETAVVDFHERNALRVAERLSSARGLMMKAGQLLSFVDTGELVRGQHWSPYQDALASLREDIEPLDGEMIAAVIQSELGQPPEQVFASFDPVPFAAASIGQVHDATLHDGRRVAVKVQYPGVAEAIQADLANTELLTTLLKLAQNTLPRMPRVDARGLADELGARIAEELDYDLERTNIDDFRRIYGDDPAIRIPNTHPELSTRRVLTMERIDGHAWTDALAAPQHLRDAWGIAIDRFFFRSIYRHGVFHADPHPGNYRFHDDGTVTVLDFGCVNRFDDDTLAGFVAVAEAAVRGDATCLRDTFVRYGFVGPDGPPAADLLEFYRPTFESLTSPQPYRMSPDYSGGVLDQLNPFGAAGEISRRFNLPPKFVLTLRIYVGLFSVLAALRAEADWRVVYDEDLRYFHEHVEPNLRIS